MEFKDIKIHDKRLFDSYFAEYPPEISELTFTNLFVWRNSKKVQFAEHEGHLIIYFPSQNFFYQPVGPKPAEIIKKVLAEYPNAHFERVQKSIAEETGLSTESQRDMYDYVYSVQELIELKGNRFEPKRNFVKQAQKYAPSVCSLSKENVSEFMQLHERWCDIKQCHLDPSLSAEDAAIKELLLNFDALRVFGMCVRIKDKIEAFAIGERLNNDTFVDHFERADPKFKGIYQFLLHEFVKIIGGFAFINREQDLGIEGLRKSKESYNPVKMVEKYIVHGKAIKL